MIRHQGWQVLNVISPDETLLDQVLQESSSPETAKQVEHA